MTEAELKRERQRAVIRRLRKTRQGETVCLARWEIELLLDYIYTMKGSANNDKTGTREMS